VRHFILIPAALSAAFAPLPFPRPVSPANDLRRMQGDWVRASRNFGEEMREDGAMRVRIDGDLLSYRRGRADLGRWRICLGQDGRLRTVDKFTTGEGGRKYRWLGVYEFRGGALAVCWTSFCNDPERPRGFEPGDEVQVEVYRRPER
jgi:uncharacterized protein (TIGR03067 family)